MGLFLIIGVVVKLQFSLKIKSACSSPEQRAQDKTSYTFQTRRGFHFPSVKKQHILEISHSETKSLIQDPGYLFWYQLRFLPSNNKIRKTSHPARDVWDRTPCAIPKGGSGGRIGGQGGRIALMVHSESLSRVTSDHSPPTPPSQNVSNGYRLGGGMGGCLRECVQIRRSLEAIGRERDGGWWGETARVSDGRERRASFGFWSRGAGRGERVCARVRGGGVSGVTGPRLTDWVQCTGNVIFLPEGDEELPFSPLQSRPPSFSPRYKAGEKG